MDEIFQELKARIVKLDSSELVLAADTIDGRLDSALNEAEVLAWLKKYIPEIKESKEIRKWYDCTYKGYPFNIKITMGNTADNMSSKWGLLYAMTGISVEEYKGYGNINNWAPFNTALVKNVQCSNKDYGFIVVFKDTKQIFLSSLKRVKVAVPNGNNLPLQIKWKDNLKYSDRTQEMQINYIMSIYKQSWLKKVSGLEPLMAWKELES